MAFEERTCSAANTEMSGLLGKPVQMVKIQLDVNIHNAGGLKSALQSAEVSNS